MEGKGGEEVESKGVRGKRGEGEGARERDGDVRWTDRKTGGSDRQTGERGRDIVTESKGGRDGGTCREGKGRQTLRKEEENT